MLQKLNVSGTELIIEPTNCRLDFGAIRNIQSYKHTGEVLFNGSVPVQRGVPKDIQQGSSFILSFTGNLGIDIDGWLTKYFGWYEMS